MTDLVEVETLIAGEFLNLLLLQPIAQATKASEPWLAALSGVQNY